MQPSLDPLEDASKEDDGDYVDCINRADGDEFKKIFLFLVSKRKRVMFEYDTATAYN